MTSPKTMSLLAAASAALLAVAAFVGVLGPSRWAFALAAFGSLGLLVVILLALRNITRELKTVRASTSQTYSILVHERSDLHRRLDALEDASDGASVASRRAVDTAERTNRALKDASNRLTEQVRTGQESTNRTLKRLRIDQDERHAGVLGRIDEVRDLILDRLSDWERESALHVERLQRIDDALLHKSVHKRAEEALLAERISGPLVVGPSQNHLEGTFADVSDPLNLLRWGADDVDRHTAHTWGGVLLDLDKPVPNPLLSCLRWTRPDLPVIGFTRHPWQRDAQAALFSAATGGALAPVPIDTGIVRFVPTPRDESCA